MIINIKNLKKILLNKIKMMKMNNFVKLKTVMLQKMIPNQTNKLNSL